MGIVSRGAVRAFAFVLAVSPAVSAENCSCRLPISGANGSITAIAGQVDIAGRAGFVAAAPGMQFGPGSRIVTGAASAANLDMGPDCRLRVNANSDVTLEKLEGAMCLRVVDASSGFDNAHAANGLKKGGLGGLPIWVPVAALGGGLLIAIAASSSKGASK